MLAPAAYVGFVACGSSSQPNPPQVDGGQTEAASDQTAPDVKPTGDSGTADAVADGGVGNMHFVAVNGLIPVLSNIRYCFAANASSDPGLGDAVPMNPQPADPGLAAGLLAPIQVPASIAGKNVRVYVYYTTSLSAFGLSSASCPQLLSMSLLSAAGDGGVVDAGASDGGAHLIQTLDFDVSDKIPSSILTAAGRYILFATGCPASSNPGQIGDPSYCGNPTGDGGTGPDQFMGDFHVFALQVDNSTPAAGKVNVQGLNGNTDFNYYAPFGGAPFAVDMGLLYGDAGVPEGGSGMLNDAAMPPPGLLNGPDDGGGTGNPFPSDISSGPLFPPTSMAPLTGVTNVFYISSAWAPAGQMPFGFPGNDQFFPMDQVLTLSGLTAADLAGSSYTLVFLGDNFLPETLADGGPNPIGWNFRLIRNDKL
jgi:hypothetical protein